MTVDGRVAASWRMVKEHKGVKLTITPHVEIRRAAWGQIRAEASRTARLFYPDARVVEIAGV